MTEKLTFDRTTYKSTGKYEQNKNKNMRNINSDSEIDNRDKLVISTISGCAL